MKLESLRIPPRLRGFAAGDAQVFDVTLSGDRVQAIAPSASQAHSRGGGTGLASKPGNGQRAGRILEQTQ